MTGSPWAVSASDWTAKKTLVFGPLCELDDQWQVKALCMILNPFMSLVYNWYCTLCNVYCTFTTSYCNTRKFKKYNSKLCGNQFTNWNCAKLQIVFVCVIAQRELEKFMREITMHWIWIHFHLFELNNAFIEYSDIWETPITLNLNFIYLNENFKLELELKKKNNENDNIIILHFKCVLVKIPN